LVERRVCIAEARGSNPLWSTKIIMEKKFVCENKKYVLEWENISLPASLKDLPPEIEVEGHRLLLKSVFHASLICIGKIIEKYNVLIPDFENIVIKDFCDFTKNHDISITGYRNEFRFVTQDEKRSVIIMVNVSNLDNFFALLNRKYDLKVEVQPAHVTLYTLQPDIGIYLTSSGDMEKLTKVIKNPIKIANLV
jgi:ribonuclease BN (tRNA processing enzyme)